MRNYEVTFIVDPVLSDSEIKGTAQAYVKLLEDAKCKITNVEEMGLRQLAYPIKKRTSGIYYCIEFQMESGVLIENMELALRRDERIMRFLTVSLDKYGVKYNDDKRNGLIGTVKKKEKTDNKSGNAKAGKPADKKTPSKPKVEAKEPAKAAPVAAAAAATTTAAAAVATSSEEEE